MPPHIRPGGTLHSPSAPASFHPDRLLADGRSVAESLAADGRYRSQYETGLSNGSRTAHPGGLRDEWKLRLFGGAYGTAAAVLDHPDGGAPHATHTRTRPDASRRNLRSCLRDADVVEHQEFGRGGVSDHVRGDTEPGAGHFGCTEPRT